MDIKKIISVGVGAIIGGILYSLVIRPIDPGRIILSAVAIALAMGFLWAYNKKK